MSDLTPPTLDESLLSAYLDDELDAPTRAVVEAQLAERAEWRAVLEEVRETREALRSLPTVDAPPEFWARVLEDDGVVVRLDAARRRSRLVRRMGAAAAVAAAVLGVAFVPRPETVQPPIGTFTQAHAERASLDNDAVSNLAGALVSPTIGP